jgi:hypothetical protein
MVLEVFGAVMAYHHAAAAAVVASDVVRAERTARFCGRFSIPGRDGGIGRRSGLKIRGPERVVGVQVPLSAPINICFYDFTVLAAVTLLPVDRTWRCIRGSTARAKWYNHIV